MDANFEPIPTDLQNKVRLMSHDLRNLRENLASGRVRPAEYAAIERVMAARLVALEAEVHARLLDESRRGRPFTVGGAG